MATALPSPGPNLSSQPLNSAAPASQIEASPLPGQPERRAAVRVATTGGVMAAFGNPIDGVTLTHVELLDRSASGLGLRSPVPVEIGSRFALYPGLARVPATAGIVARCEPEGDEFRVGLRCDPRKAA